MADYLGRVREILLAHVQLHPDRFMTKGSPGHPRRPCKSSLARAMGLPPSTVARILNGEGFRKGSKPRKPYRPGPNMVEGLQRLLELEDEAAVWTVLTAPSLIEVRRL